jgi:benzoyl-CoA 2,3-epoxidase subunit B
VSSNAASYFANGLKGRAKEDTYDDHVVNNAVYNMEFFEEGRTVPKEVLMRNAMNEVLRDWYVGDCAAGVERWNRVLERYGLSERLRLPDRKFNRGIGMYAGFHFDPNGVVLSNEEWERRRYEWLPSAADSEYLLSIMASPVYERGKFANYIAPPRRGVNQQPIDFEYVRTEQ